MEKLQILLCGCLGRMGHAVTAAVAASADIAVAAGVDARAPQSDTPYPVYPEPDGCTQPLDAIVDFSSPAALAQELDFAVRHRLPLVLATTGLSEEQRAAVRAAAAEIPVFMSGNMSLGIAVLSALTKKAAAVLGDTFDIEILEMHHDQKLDAPSGTALMLADAARAGLDRPMHNVYDRHDRRQKRDKDEIGISSIRAGNIIGEHQVIFGGGDEVVTLSHRAQSRNIFAAGALAAVRFLQGKPAGLYDMNDLVGAL